MMNHCQHNLYPQDKDVTKKYTTTNSLIYNARNSIYVKMHIHVVFEMWKCKHMRCMRCTIKMYFSFLLVYLIYSLRPILLFANTDVCLDTSVLAKSNMGRREYIFSSTFKNFQ
jgi:hypothetical protein